MIVTAMKPVPSCNASKVKHSFVGKVVLVLCFILFHVVCYGCFNDEQVIVRSLIIICEAIGVCRA